MAVQSDFFTQFRKEDMAFNSVYMVNGLWNTGRSMFSTVPVGSVAYGSFGTEAVHVAGTLYVAEVFVGRNMTLTGVKVLNGATVGTDKLLAALYDENGVLVANSAAAGATSAGADAFQALAFTTTYDAKGPKRYFIGVQCNGTTAKTRRIAASTFIDVAATSSTGTFGTIPATITPPTTFTADMGPIAFVY